MNLCKFKDILGKPKTGIHSYRVFDFAIVDIIGTIVLGVILSKWTSISLWKAVLAMFVIGELLHLIFCVDTKFISYLTN